MSRQYLFRGKRVDNGEWVYGAYYKQKQFYGDKCEQDCIITSDDILSNDLGLDYEEVIPETVGQYVGLKDKHGKKVFENDIVVMKPITHYSDKRDYYKVLFSTKDIASCGCCYERFTGSGFVCENYLGERGNLAYNEDLEVVGNVIDNKELLGE